MDEQIKVDEAAAGHAKPVERTNLKVDVGLLDTLMNLAGELVLSRNQLMQGIQSTNIKATEVSSQRIDMITSELQEAIMRTRMQPIGNILNKFSRLVRDMSRDQGKSIDLILEGNDVELDKTILESIDAPLTRLVKNAVDCGIELPDEREATGKDGMGIITLKAFHDAGQMNIMVSDDGRGIDPEALAKAAVSLGMMKRSQVLDMSEKQKMELVFKPEISNQSKALKIAGLGPKMDTVIQCIEKLGGVIELDFAPGKGMAFHIKLPLTLAIIPSQILSVQGEKFAVPQVNLNELLRIHPARIKDEVEKIGNTALVRLRGELLPLVDLANLLDIDKTYYNHSDNKVNPDRRINIADRRSKQHSPENDRDKPENTKAEKIIHKRQAEDRRYHSNSALNIAVVTAGAYKYGLVVDHLNDSEEIVVKPVGKHLKSCSAFSGATIMGDGKVALILDISNIAQMAQLSDFSETQKNKDLSDLSHEGAEGKEAMLTFKNAENEFFAVNMDIVQRIERIETSKIEQVGGQEVVQYRGGALSLYELSQVINISTLPRKEYQEVIVFRIKDKEIGLMVTPPVDVVEMNVDIDDKTLKQPAVKGSVIIDDHTALVLDIVELMKIIET